MSCSTFTRSAVEAPPMRPNPVTSTSCRSSGRLPADRGGARRAWIDVSACSSTRSSSPMTRSRACASPGSPRRERAVRVARRVGATRVHRRRRPRRSAPRSRRGARDARARDPRRSARAHAARRAAGRGARRPRSRSRRVGVDGAYAGAFVATGARGDARDRGARARRATRRAIARDRRATQIPHGEIARHAIAHARRAPRRAQAALPDPDQAAGQRDHALPVPAGVVPADAAARVDADHAEPDLVPRRGARRARLLAHRARERRPRRSPAPRSILAASYLDCCDGEIARVKLLSSRFGAWIDTIVDELSSIGYMVALGWHCHLAFGPNYFGDLGFDPWLGRDRDRRRHVRVVDLLHLLQHHRRGRLGEQPGLRRPLRGRARRAAEHGAARAGRREGDRAARSRCRRWLAWLATYAPYIVRRDFISWGATLLAALHLTQLSFAMLVAGGGDRDAWSLALDHVRLRALRRSIARAGQVLESPSR